MPTTYYGGSSIVPLQDYLDRQQFGPNAVAMRYMYNMSAANQAQNEGNAPAATGGAATGSGSIGGTVTQGSGVMPNTQSVGNYAPWQGSQTPQQMGLSQSQYYNAALQNDPRQELIQSQMSGQLNPDVLSNIYQSAAERGIATGTAGSASSNAAMLRAVGQTTMGLQQQGLQNYGAMMQSYAQLNPTAISQMNLQDYLSRVGEAAADNRAIMQRDTQMAIAQMGNAQQMSELMLQQSFQAAQNAINRDMQMTMQERQFANQLVQQQYQTEQQRRQNLAYQGFMNSLNQGQNASPAAQGGTGTLTPINNPYNQTGGGGPGGTWDNQDWEDFYYAQGF